MIPRAFITAWRSEAPWQTNEQVEQDLVISRTLVEIYSDELLQRHLAFRGGTALYKLFLMPPVRYSEDIDLVQIKSGPIGPIFDRLQEKLNFLGAPRRSQRNQNNTLLYRFESEIPPIIRLRLKIEINCREHFAIFGVQQKLFKVQSPWFNDTAQLTTFTLEELLGSKLRALYQRKKGRDLFDLWYALTITEVNCNQVIHSFHRFMEASGASVTRRQFENNLQNKINDIEFLGDTTALLRTDVIYDPQIAHEQVMENLIRKLD
ncbi:nucleotidyltransferase [candidate division KSB1 bacterium 4484_188]|nr:MAG: nucleotidyltransferase [candidate division KSB1 bacterium 4484_188]